VLLLKRRSLRQRAFFDLGTVFPKTLWETYERNTALGKFECALHHSKKPNMDKGSNPYQDAKIVIDLRNALVHFKPGLDTQADEHLELSNKLKNK
jgi:hypothetical protein